MAQKITQKKSPKAEVAPQNTKSQYVATVIENYFSSEDIALIKGGHHGHLYKKLGVHPMEKSGEKGAYFAVWAPNAKSVAVIGDFNQWDRETHFLQARKDNSGIWEGFLPNIKVGDYYKYFITSLLNGYAEEKIDPFAFSTEVPPKTASIVTDLEYQWNDEKWIASRTSDYSRKPMSTYEVHLGSWMKTKSGRFLSYRELADRLVDYVADLGFTHVEFMPITEHPFYGSWGYQTLSYFASSSRYGSPQDLMYLIDKFHQAGIGVIVDWVPSHFPADEHGLANFDGTQLYEHPSGRHPDWDSLTFDLGRYEVSDFLISSALFWLDKYHIDGIRVDAVASMLYLDYSRKDGQWMPNIHGGRENLESIVFLKKLNDTIKAQYPQTMIIAEESTAWPQVSGPTSEGGLGFDMKWNMGWMHDTLKFFRRSPGDRGFYPDEIAFCLYYAFSEKFVLSLSHDEVVHGKGSLLAKMPDKDEIKFASLRALLGYMYSHPGKKLLFMGIEIGQWSEWDHDGQLQWELLEYPEHQGIKTWVNELNKLYKNEPALHGRDFTSDGFEWLDMGRNQEGVFSFIRKGANINDAIVIVCNFKDEARKDYKVGLPQAGLWVRILSSEDAQFGGCHQGGTNDKEAQYQSFVSNGYGNMEGSAYRVKEYTMSLELPPLSVTFYKKAK